MLVGWPNSKLLVIRYWLFDQENAAFEGEVKTTNNN
jgi:hypothetical protein